MVYGILMRLVDMWMDLFYPPKWDINNNLIVLTRPPKGHDSKLPAEIKEAVLQSGLLIWAAELSWHGLQLN